MYKRGPWARSFILTSQIRWASLRQLQVQKSFTKIQAFKNYLLIHSKYQTTLLSTNKSLFLTKTYLCTSKETSDGD